MKKVFTAALLCMAIASYSQTVFGYWYGNANVKTKSSANNYLIELVLQPEKTQVKGMLNYYFKNTYRSLPVKGSYNAASRQLFLYNIPLTYFGSFAAMEVDCIMDMRGTLRISQIGSNLYGSFVAPPDYKRMCPDILFDLTLNADASKIDSVLKDISEFKENYQVWTPEKKDTLVAVSVTPPPKKVINYVTEKQFTERENVVTSEIEVASDSLIISMYDNGEIDGDIISIFYNKNLILNSQKLTHKSIRINLRLDPQLEANEISMFAENLGLIAPNTALMIIDDGTKKHEIRVSSNLEKTSTIKIRRKK
jgi:hypothetical protein